MRGEREGREKGGRREGRGKGRERGAGVQWREREGEKRGWWEERRKTERKSRVNGERERQRK